MGVEGSTHEASLEGVVKRGRALLVRRVGGGVLTEEGANDRGQLVLQRIAIGLQFLQHIAGMPDDVVPGVILGKRTALPCFVREHVYPQLQKAMKTFQGGQLVVGKRGPKVGGGVGGAVAFYSIEVSGAGHVNRVEPEAATRIRERVGRKNRVTGLPALLGGEKGQEENDVLPSGVDGV